MGFGGSGRSPYKEDMGWSLMAWTSGESQAL